MGTCIDCMVYDSERNICMKDGENLTFDPTENYACSDFEAKNVQKERRNELEEAIELSQSNLAFIQSEYVKDRKIIIVVEEGTKKILKILKQIKEKNVLRTSLPHRTYEDEPHCSGCWHISYNSETGNLHATCNECDAKFDIESNYGILRGQISRS